jgi:hypothetical protein
MQEGMAWACQCTAKPAPGRFSCATWLNAVIGPQAGWLVRLRLVGSGPVDIAAKRMWKSGVGLPDPTRGPTS